MSQRPATSKARGVCNYYRSRRGCLNGDMCKFLHGSGETVSPYDKSKTCKFFAAGFCKRGDKCWFRHAGSTSAASAFEVGVANAQTSFIQGESEDEENLCCICQERPVTYGLLEGCSHIYCLECVRGWRDPSGKSRDIVDSGNTKRCPYCRASSKFVTPSSLFYPNEDPLKAVTIAQYKASMDRIPCKYFEKSQPGKRHCPFGSDCFYQHKEADGTLYVFPHGADYYMSRLRNHVRSRNVPFFDAFPFLRTIRTENDVLQTLSELRSRLESLHLVPPSNAPNNVHPEENFISRLVDDVLSSLEDALAGSGSGSSEQEEHAEVPHSAPSRPSILASPEDTYINSGPSLLPLTRAFMDNNILAEERDDTSESLVRQQDEAFDSETRHRSIQWLANLTDEDSGAEDTGSETLDGVTGLSSQNDDAERMPQRLPNNFFGDMDEPQVITVDSDVESDSDADDSPERSGGQRATDELLPSPGPEEGDEGHHSRPTAIHSRGGDHEPCDSEPRNNSEPCKEPILRRSKPYSGPISRSSRRTANQSFVTDGRGRVVATDDGASAASLTFWPPAAHVTMMTQSRPSLTSDGSGTEVDTEVGDGLVDFE